ncbi:hypothetical protein ACLOJK_003927 [Asimina triloba]
MCTDTRAPPEQQKLCAPSSPQGRQPWLPARVSSRRQRRRAGRQRRAASDNWRRGGRTRQRRAAATLAATRPQTENPSSPSRPQTHLHDGGNVLSRRRRDGHLQQMTVSAAAPTDGQRRGSDPSPLRLRLRTMTGNGDLLSAGQNLPRRQATSGSMGWRRGMSGGTPVAMGSRSTSPMADPPAATATTNGAWEAMAAHLRSDGQDPAPPSQPPAIMISSIKRQ